MAVGCLMQGVSVSFPGGDTVYSQIQFVSGCWELTRRNGDGLESGVCVCVRRYKEGKKTGLPQGAVESL